MLVIPAVDIKDGKCVRLIQGHPDRETVYSDNPVEVALMWQDKGAERIHIVDLDGAFSGAMKNIDIVLKIARDLDIPVQAGGGIRNIATIDKLVAGGVKKVIVGTAAIYDQELLGTALKKYGGYITVGIDSDSEKVAVRGWVDVTDKMAVTLAAEMENMGVGELIITDITKDGTLTGPNVGLVEKVAESVSIPVIASGGVSSIADIVRFKNSGQDNITGVIVGKALYDRSMEFEDAVAAVRNGG